MTTAITDIIGTNNKPSERTSSSLHSGTEFKNSLLLERADRLLSVTNQYDQWQTIRQTHPQQAQKVAELLLARDMTLHGKEADESKNWQLFNLLTEQIASLGIELPHITPLATDSVNAQTVFPFAQSATALIKKENQLILNAVIQGKICGYGDEQTTLLPLQTLADTLGLPITVSVQEGKAAGWYIDEKQSFTLDVGQKSLRIRGKAYPWPEGAIAVEKDDIYVDSRQLAQWFPVKLQVQRNEEQPIREPRKKIPQQMEDVQTPKRQKFLSQAAAQQPVSTTPPWQTKGITPHIANQPVLRESSPSTQLTIRELEVKEPLAPPQSPPAPQPPETEEEATAPTTTSPTPAVAPEAAPPQSKVPVPHQWPGPINVYRGFSPITPPIDLNMPGIAPLAQQDDPSSSTPEAPRGYASTVAEIYAAMQHPLKSS